MPNETVTSAGLKPCPFCGGEAQVAPDEIGSGGQHVPPYHAGCFRGGGCGVVFTSDDLDEAIAEWNRRAVSIVTPADVAGLVKRLRTLCSYGDARLTDKHDALSEQTATALEALSVKLTTERAAHAETKRERDEALKALERLLASPALADENHSDPEWGCGETAIAVLAADYRILGPGELDVETVERCIKELNKLPWFEDVVSLVDVEDALRALGKGERDAG